MQNPLDQNHQPEIHRHPTWRTDMEKCKNHPAVKPNTKHRQTEKEPHPIPATAHPKGGKMEEKWAFENQSNRKKLAATK